MWRPGARFAVFALAAAGVAIAQKVISAKAGMVYFVQGRVLVEGRRLNGGGTIRQLKAGETLSTDRGRVEVLLNPGTVLRLAEMGRMRMENVDLTDARLTIGQGAAVVTLNNPPKLDRVELHAGGGVVVLKGLEGIYRFDAGPSANSRTRLRVYNGQASVRLEDAGNGTSGGSESLVKAGYAVMLDNLEIAKFDTKETDTFEQWAEARGRRPALRGLRPMPPRIAWGDGATRASSNGGGSQDPLATATPGGNQ